MEEFFVEPPVAHRFLSRRVRVRFLILLAILLAASLCARWFVGPRWDAFWIRVQLAFNGTLRDYRARPTADLRGKKLAGIDLQAATLRGANLQEADLRGARLGGAVLVGCDLRGAALVGADLLAADLSGADLGGADLRKANLRGADLRGAVLRGARLGQCRLTGADLFGADLRGAEDIPIEDIIRPLEEEGGEPAAPSNERPARPPVSGQGAENASHWSFALFSRAERARIFDRYSETIERPPGFESWGQWLRRDIEGAREDDGGNAAGQALVRPEAGRARS